MRIDSTTCAGRAIALFWCAIVVGAPVTAAELVGVTSATFGWAPATGPVEGYLVYVSRNGADPLAVVVVDEPRVTLAGYDFGEAIEISVRAMGHGTDGRWIPGPSSEVSETVTFDPSPRWPADGALLLHCASCASLRYVPADDVAAEPLAEVLAPGAGWELVDVGDYDGNGERDVLWRDAIGRLLAYLMRDRTVAKVSYLIGSGLSEHHVVGSGDFDGDGDAEIVLRHSSGRVFFLEPRAQLLAPIAFLTEDVGEAQTAAPTVGVGDFDGDGAPELLRRGGDGNLETWTVDHFEAGPRVRVGATLPQDWSLAQLAEVDGDGTTDLVWRMGSRGWLVLKMRDGRAAGGWLIPSEPGDEHRELRTSAALFPGRSELLLLQDSVTGRVTIVDADPRTDSGRIVLLDPGSGWTVEGFAD